MSRSANHHRHLYCHYYLFVYNTKQQYQINYVILVISAPALVIYDNACNLHRYALNRDPEFFTNTKFTVDRFHWSNHTGLTFYTNDLLNLHLTS